MTTATDSFYGQSLERLQTESSSQLSEQPVEEGTLSRQDSAATSNSNAKGRSNHAPRRSLSVLNNLPKEISALIRSHSNSRRNYPTHERNPSIDGESDDMLGDDDRPSRRSKFENKASLIYNFLTRSRSRSRSKAEASVAQQDEPIPELPTKDLSLESSTDPFTLSKPPTRLPSRPLSSTTTATNTTVTPNTPRPKHHAPAPISLDQRSQYVENRTAAIGGSLSRPSTPKASGARKKIQNLFGIALASPKKSSFASSRHSSRTPSLDIPSPPVAGRGTEIDYLGDPDPTPKPQRIVSPRPSREASPTPGSRTKLVVVNTNASTHSASSATSKLQRLFSGNKAASVPSPEDVSGPIKHSHQRRNSSLSQRLPSPEPTLLRAATMGPPPPRITHTPATPLRQEEATKRGVTANNPRSRRRRDSAENSTESTSRETSSGHGKGKERDVGTRTGNVSTGARTTYVRGHSIRDTRHGSFDFEKPGWSAGGVMQRTASGGTTGTGTSSTSGRNPHRDGFLNGIRESAMGPGMAGIGTLQRDASLKRSKEREEMIARVREEERRKKVERSGEIEKNASRRAALKDQHHKSLQPPPRPSMIAEQDNVTGRSSSLGKASGKQSGLHRSGSNAGRARIIPIGISHGPFSFEPPVPSPTLSTGSGAGEQLKTVTWAETKVGKSELEREGARQEMGKEKRKEKERRSGSYRTTDRAPVPVPTPAPGFGHRSATKGRSLDLGLGLAWAPSTMKEEALLPSSTFFIRSVSGSSSQSGWSTPKSQADNSGKTSKEIQDERSKVGREVAEVFKNALDDDNYERFKRYIHRFDAHDIPFDGPKGIVARVEGLLMSAPTLSEEGKRRLLDNFVRVVLQNA